jgi:hypothetical protein
MTRLREIIAAFLTAVLLITPVWGAPTAALGTVVSADRAQVSGTLASVGSTVFGGDRLSTAQAGRVQFRTSAAQFLLWQSSIATLGEEDGTPSATLLEGSATFSTANAKAFVVHMSTAAIRPRSDEPTIGQVTVLGAKQLLVKCARGALTLTVDDDSRVIPEGMSYRVFLDPAEAPGAQSQPPAQGAGSKGGTPPLFAAKNRFIWVVAGGAAVITYLAVTEAMESPHRP